MKYFMRYDYTLVSKHGKLYENMINKQIYLKIDVVTP